MTSAGGTASPEVGDSRSGDEIAHEAYRESIERLRANSVEHGFLAAPHDRRNYRAVWARDGCLCAVAAYLSGDAGLMETARRTLHTLADHQSDNGQVPSYLLVEGDGRISEVNYSGYGEVTSIDSSLWFLFACHAIFRQGGEHEFVEHPLHERYREVIRYLRSIDANSCGLLEIPIAGDWSDILNRSYHVLYDEVLWFRALYGAAELAEGAGDHANAASYAHLAVRVWRRLNDDFWWDDAEVVRRVAEKYMIRNPLPREPCFPYYQSHLTPFIHNWPHRFDAFANVLAALMGVAPPDRVEAIVRRVMETGLDHPHPLRVLDPPIREDDPDAFQLRISDEPPFSYHNGGIWPLAGGFWVVFLARLGRGAEAGQALVNLAGALRLAPAGRPPWGMYEYLHGRTCEPSGTRHLSWSAAAYVLAYRAQVDGRMAHFAQSDGDPLAVVRRIAGDSE